MTTDALRAAEEAARTFSALASAPTMRLPTLSAPAARFPLPVLPIDEEGADLHTVEVLGRGGMGVVELAEQRSLGRLVAVKRPHPGSVDADAVAALLAEGVTMGTLAHPNIVPVHALGRAPDGRAVLVMKRIDGVPLAVLAKDLAHPFWARERRDRVTVFVEATIEVLHALSFAHARGTVHRDIKPENVMLGDFGEVYLLDWGIAAPLGQPSPAIAGTPAYMAPEMLQPSVHPPDARTDVYLVAAMLHHCLAGAPPHAGATLHAVLCSVAVSVPPDYGPEVPEELAGILRAALSANASERPQSADALRARLEDFLRHRATTELVVAGERRLAELSALVSSGRSAVEIHGAFEATRFAFQQALSGWSESERGRSGLRSALLLMARHEISERNHGAATALVAAIDDPPPELARALGELAASLESDAAVKQRLSRMAAERDPAVSRSERTLIGRLAAVGHTLAVAALLYFDDAPQLDLGAPVLFAVTLGVVIAALIGGWVVRGWAFRNRRNRQITLGLFAVLFAVLFSRGAAALSGRSVEDAVETDLLIVATGAAIGAIAIRRLYAVAALVFAAASVVAAALPGSGLAVALVASVIALWSIVLFPGRAEGPLLDALERSD